MQWSHGAKLPNGATVIAFEPDRRGGYTVLAMWRDEYITWKADDNGVCYWGRYTDNFIKATKDYAERAELELTFA